MSDQEIFDSPKVIIHLNPPESEWKKMRRRVSNRFWTKLIGGLIGVIVTLCIWSGFEEEENKVVWEWKNATGQVKLDIDKSDPTSPPFPPKRGCYHSLVRKRTFPTLRLCSNYTTRLCQEGTFNLTALVSYPGSGNTWLRHLLEISSGFFTGSVYFDHTLYARGFLGENEDWSSGSTLAQKLHVHFDPRQNFQKGILIIREPVAATRSFVGYMESGHTGWASPITFNKKEWPSFLLRSTHDWLALAKSWIESPIELMVIHYENLVASPFSEVRNILRFLELDESRMNSECFKKSIEGSFHRKAPVWKMESPPSLKIRSIIDDGVDYLNQLLVEHGKEEIPLDKYLCYRKISDKCIEKKEKWKEDQ